MDTPFKKKENIHEAYVCGKCAYEFGWIELFFSEKKSLVSGAENQLLIRTDAVEQSSEL